VRNDAGIRVRQPLSELVVHGDDRTLADFLDRDEVVASVLDELNVKTIRAADSIGEFAELTANPNFPALGKRFGKRVPGIADAIKKLDTEALVRFDGTGVVTVNDSQGEVTLTRDDVALGIAGKSGFGAGTDRGVTVGVNLEITEALKLEGLAREAINRLQNLRKNAGLDVTDRIRVCYADTEAVGKVFASQGALVKNETLAVELEPGEPGWEHSVSFTIGGAEFRLWLQKVE
jgi:isoleucyl-tRNA synthetase